MTLSLQEWMSWTRYVHSSPTLSLFPSMFSPHIHEHLLMASKTLSGDWSTSNESVEVVHGAVPFLCWVLLMLRAVFVRGPAYSCSSAFATPPRQLSARISDAGSGKMSSSSFSTPPKMACATETGEDFGMSKPRVMSMSVGPVRTA
jgi:hypothetical protein